MEVTVPSPQAQTDGRRLPIDPSCQRRIEAHIPNHPHYLYISRACGSVCGRPSAPAMGAARTCAPQASPGRGRRRPESEVIDLVVRRGIWVIRRCRTAGQTQTDGPVRPGRGREYRTDTGHWWRRSERNEAPQSRLICYRTALTYLFRVYHSEKI